jgi:hypothetical protein
MSEYSTVRSARPARRLSVSRLLRAPAYLAAMALFATLALTPALLAIGVAGRHNPLGYLAAMGWAFLVAMVVWGFGSAVRRPGSAVRPQLQSVPPRRLNGPALLAAAGVAAVLAMAMVQAWA